MAYRTDTLQNEKQGEARAKGEIKHAKVLRDETGKTIPAANLKAEIAQFYKDIEKHPASTSFRMGLPDKKNLKAISSASPQQLEQWTNTFAQRKADYEQQIKAIAPAAQPKAVVPPASAVPTPSNTTTNPRAASAPVAAATIERLGNKAKALSGYAEKSAGAAAALKAARDKLPATSRQKNQTQAAKPTDNTAASVGMGAPIGGIATGAAMKMAQQATQQPDTLSDKADALIQKFDNQTTQATKDANKAVQSQVSQAASPLNQLQPFDEVKAMEYQMRRGGYQIQEGGLKKDGAGYHVIDEQGRKLMVAPTQAMRRAVMEKMSGIDKLDNTLKAGQTMSDIGRANMGLAPQQTAQAGGVQTTDFRPVNTEQNPRGKVFMDALANEFKEQTYRELDAKANGTQLDPKMQTREYAHAMAAAADAQSRQVQPAPLAASAPNPAGTVRRVLTDPKYGGTGVGYATETPKANVTPEQYANRPQAPQPSTGNPAVVGTNSAGVAATPNVAAPKSEAADPFSPLVPASPNFVGPATPPQQLTNLQSQTGLQTQANETENAQKAQAQATADQTRKTQQEIEDEKKRLSQAQIANKPALVQNVAAANDSEVYKGLRTASGQ
jgi:hypothetical protein